MLAHAAFEEGMRSAENAAARLRGQEPQAPYPRAVPRCVFSHPEVAAVGLTEEEARARYGEVVTVSLPFSSVAKALVEGETVGFVKVIMDSTPQRNLLGVCMVGPGATELISLATLALDIECSAEELGGMLAAHPTLSEAIKEACLLALGRPLHSAELPF